MDNRDETPGTHPCPRQVTHADQTDPTRQGLIGGSRLNETTGRWEDAGTVFHRVVVFNQQARHVADSLHKGDSVLVAGDLRFGTYTNTDTGETRETRDIVADNIGASLKFANVEIARSPKAEGPDAYATGPTATPAATGVGIVR